MSSSAPEGMPETVYHYTDQKGLLNILRTGIIWATKLQYLNDSAESLVALELARQIFAERRQACSDEGGLRRIGALQAECECIQYLNVCACSFSEERDLLSQWRAYGGSNGGFAIGFATESLGQRAEEQRFIFVKCEYDSEAQRRCVESLIDGVLGSEFYVQPDFDQVRSALTTKPIPTDSELLERFAEVAAAIKHHGFHEESEWRLVSRGIWNDGLCYRPGSSMIVPYYEFRLGSDVGSYINSITVGPCPHVELSRSAVRMFLSQLCGRRRVEVLSSAIPYRSW